MPLIYTKINLYGYLHNSVVLGSSDLSFTNCMCDFADENLLLSLYCIFRIEFFSFPQESGISSGFRSNRKNKSGTNCHQPPSYVHAMKKKKLRAINYRISKTLGKKKCWAVENFGLFSSSDVRSREYEIEMQLVAKTHRFVFLKSVIVCLCK